MNKRYKLEPEVAGQLGFNTVIDVSTVPHVVKKLHYVFYGWLGDDLLESYPCYICTESLSNAIKQQNLTGCYFDDCEISKSEEFLELQPSLQLPIFYWLRINGSPNDDLSIDGQGSLTVSENALTLLRNFQLNHCNIEETE